MAYGQHNMSANYVPGFDDYYMPPAAPEVHAPKPERYNPDMSAQIAEGIQHMDLNNHPRASTVSTQSHYPQADHTASIDPAADLSPFPKLINSPPTVPPSDSDLESRLESSRNHVLNSNDPELQLSWASDVLLHCGASADDAERTALAKPSLVRPSTPRIEHQLKLDAKSIVAFLADQHHPRAEYLRGTWLEWGRFGEREDKKEAFRCYSRAADKGFARAEYRIGMLYESYNDPVKALRHYHRGVDAGDAASCYRLGMMTLRGQHGQQQDFARGLDLIRRSAAAADDGAAQGAYVYGMLLSRQLPQIEIPEGYLQYDERLAKENIERAAFLKFAKAQTKMGLAYELGTLGCGFDPAMSIHYNALASKQGEAEADMALSKWFLVGSEGIFSKNEDLAFHYAERAAQSGLATAEFALGYFNEIGMGTSVDLDKAMEWYEKASKHGNQDAKGRIDALANKQVLSRRDHEKVAIHRIKSQHAPNRHVQSQVPPVPQLGQSPGSNGYNDGHLPQRGSSTTPYPQDNGPPQLPPNQRAPSVVPYPEDDHHVQHSSPYLGVGPTNGQQQGFKQRPSTAMTPEMRPSSAFQINPEIRANSVAAVPQQGYNQRFYPDAPPNGPGPRSYSAQPGDPYNRPMTAVTSPRIASGPSAMQSHPQQQNGPPVPAKYPSYPPNMQSSQSPPNAAPRINVGYTAPYEERKPRPDPTYAEPQPRQRLNSGNMSGRSNTYGMQAPQSQNYTQANQQSSSRPADYRRPVNGGTTPQPSSQQRTSSRPQPQQQQQQQQPQQQQQQPQQQSQVGGRPAPGGGAGSGNTTGLNASGKTLPQKPLPKPAAPKTFEEMGVPIQKREEECVVM